MALKFEPALRVNGTDFRRKTGVNPETFAEMETRLRGRVANTGKSVRPPAVPAGALVLLTLVFWWEDRTASQPGQAWGVNETTIR